MERLAFSVEEVADMLGLSKQHLWRLIRGGKLKAVNVSAGEKPVWRIPVPYLTEFLSIMEVEEDGTAGDTL